MKKLSTILVTSSSLISLASSSLAADKPNVVIIYGDDEYNDGTTVRTSTKDSDGGHDGSGPYRGG